MLKKLQNIYDWPDDIKRLKGEIFILREIKIADGARVGYRGNGSVDGIFFNQVFVRMTAFNYLNRNEQQQKKCCCHSPGQYVCFTCHKAKVNIFAT